MLEILEEVVLLTCELAVLDGIEVKLGILELLLLHAARTSKVSKAKDSLLVFRLNITFPHWIKFNSLIIKEL